MPKEEEEKIRASLREAHPDWSEEKLESVTYATMNKRGMLRGKRAGSDRQNTK